MTSAQHVASLSNRNIAAGYKERFGFSAKYIEVLSIVMMTKTSCVHEILASSDITLLIAWCIWCGKE